MKEIIEEPKTTVELTKEEIANLKVCCIKVAKSADTLVNDMKYLLNLSDKLDQIKVP